MSGWSSGTLQSKIRSGFVAARRWQSAHSLLTSAPRDATSASPNAGRHAGQPTELMTSSGPGMPSSVTSVHARSMTSASTAGSETPKTSTSSWWNCRYRPFCGRSYRNIGPKR